MSQAARPADAHWRAALQRGEGVDQRIEGLGHLHLDRPLPFLCLYRHGEEPDPGLKRLLTAQANYCLATDQPDRQAALRDWLAPLLAELVSQFGAVLLLELWPQVEGDGGPAFTLHAPRHGAPQRLLERLEGALAQVHIHRRNPRIALQYRDAVAPPGLPPLCPGVAGVQCLGLAVAPVFRDPDSGALYSFAYPAYRRRFTRALKRALYTFALHYTRHRPAHYHELGPRAFTRTAAEVDRRLAQIDAGFDLLLHVSPVNSAAAWAEFEAGGFQRPPELLYRPRTLSVTRLKRALWAIPVERIADPALNDLFSARRDELDRQLTLLADRNTPRFLFGSRQLFGDPPPAVVADAQWLLERLPPRPSADARSEPLDASAFARRAEAELAWYREQAPELAARVELRDDIPGIMVSHGNFLIGRDARVPPQRVGAALAHEIGIHALTWFNGSQQPLQGLRNGLAGYEPLQEGLAVLAEYLVDGLTATRLRQLAGRVEAVRCLTDGASFVDTFRRLHTHWGFPARSAFMTTLRCFRGGGYTKDAIYLQGLRELLARLAEGVALDTLLLGKISLPWLPVIEELRWRHVLQPPRLRPRFLDTDTARARLQRVRRGLTLRQLAEEISP